MFGYKLIKEDGYKTLGQKIKDLEALLTSKRNTIKMLYDRISKLSMATSASNDIANDIESFKTYQGTRAEKEKLKAEEDKFLKDEDKWEQFMWNAWKTISYQERVNEWLKSELESYDDAT